MSWTHAYIDGILELYLLQKRRAAVSKPPDTRCDRSFSDQRLCSSPLADALGFIEEDTSPRPAQASPPRGRRSSTASTSSNRTLLQTSVIPQTPPPIPKRHDSPNAVLRQRALFDELDSPEISPPVRPRVEPKSARRKTSEGKLPSKRRSRNPSSAANGMTLFISTAPDTMQSQDDDYVIAEQQHPASPKPMASPPRRRIASPTSSRSKLPEANTSRAARSASSPSQAKAFLSSFAKLLQDVAAVVIRIATEVGLPLLYAATASCYALLMGQQAKSRIKSAPLKQTKIPTLTAGTSFAEKFKYIICTSFLLTGSLSLSFYESNEADRALAPQMLDNTAVHEREREYLTKWSARPTRRTSLDLVHCSISSADVCGPDSGERTLPRLSRFGRQLRDASFLALVLAYLFSPSSQIWFKTSLLLSALSWPVILSLSQLEDPASQLSFQIERRDSVEWHASLVQVIRRQERQARLLSAVRSLVTSCQAADQDFNRVIAAVQEVELVARGFKITHPLPPISRIEATSTSLAASPMRDHRAQTNGTKSGDPRSSPLPDSDEKTSDRKTVEPRRMAELRRSLSKAFEVATQEFNDMLQTLQPLVDHEELASLYEIYSLVDAVEAFVEPSHDLAYHLSGSQEPSPMLPGGRFSEVDGSYSSPTFASKRSSWGMAMARGPIKRGSIHTGSPATYDDSIGSVNLLSSPRGSSTNQQKRFSLTPSDISNLGASHPMGANLSGGGSSLSRNSSLMRRSSISRPGTSLSDASAAADGSYPPPSSETRSKTSGRLSYISENSSGPNSTPAAKRLSYQSSDGRSSSRLNLTHDTLEPPSSLLYASSPTLLSGSILSRQQQSPSPYAMRHVGSRSRSGSVYSQTAFGPAAPDIVDKHTILGLKTAFEQLHVVRRRALCHLLALRFSLDSASTTSTGDFDRHSYWLSVERSMLKTTVALNASRQRMDRKLAADMGSDRSNELEKAESDDGLDDSVETKPEGLLSYSGFEECSEAIASSIRSIQVKLRACAEELSLSNPPALHGSSGSAATPRLSGPADASTRKDNAERVWESLKEELISLTQEYEAGSKIFKAERRQQSRGGASPLPSKIDSHGLIGEGRSSLESSQDGDETRANESVASRSESVEHSNESSEDGRSEVHTSDDDTDLAAILLRSTSPNHLPPPGLEQVFESIAGIASSFAESNGQKMSREDRIRKVKEQREEAKKAQQDIKATRGGRQAQAGVVNELKGVLDQRKLQREAEAQAANVTNGAGKTGHPDQSRDQIRTDTARTVSAS